MDDMTHVAILLVKAAPGLLIIGAASGRAKVLGYDALALLFPLRQPDGRASGETLDEVLTQVQQAGSLSLPWNFQTRAGETRPPTCCTWR